MPTTVPANHRRRNTLDKRSPSSSSRPSTTSTPNETVRVWVNVGVAYGSDLAAARKALLGVAAGDADVLKDPAPMVVLDDFGDSSIDLSLVIWVNAALAEHGITIPFPQRDLHIKSGLPPTAPADERRSA